VVLLAVEAYDIEAAAAPLQPLIEGGACVVSVLNGVDYQDRIASVPGASSVLGGPAMVSGVIVEPGLIRYISAMSGLRFGETDGSMSNRAVTFQDVCLPADIVPRTLALHQSFPMTRHASKYHDLVKGRPLELDSFSDHVGRRGRALGFATPVHEMAWLALKPCLHGAPAPFA